MNCSRIGCPNEGVWNPVLVLRAPLDYKAPPTRAALCLPLCDEHKAQTKLVDVLNDEGWTFISRNFQALGKLVPERALTRLDFDTIEEG